MRCEIKSLKGNHVRRLFFPFRSISTTAAINYLIRLYKPAFLL